MSMRDGVFSVTSVNSICDVIASGDDVLSRKLCAEHAAQYVGDDLLDEVVQQDIEERRSIVESMIHCNSPPEKEDGGWGLLLEEIARHLGLDPRPDLPFNEGWKHVYVWKAYRPAVKKHVSRQSRRSLEYLDDGRPLLGKQVDGGQGCLFAWLSADEVQELYGSLSQLDDTIIADAEMVAFHETLVESLQIVSAQQRDLILVAC
jgi:hypothetical protein